MNDLTRREFLNTAAGAAVGGAVVGRTAFLNAATDRMLHLLRLAPGGVNCAGPCAPLESVIFPKPQEISDSGSNFLLDNQVRVVVPPNASAEDLFLARSLVDELGDRFDLHLKIERTASLNANARIILMGSIRESVGPAVLHANGRGAGQRIPGPEGYILRTSRNIVLVAGSDDRGAFYGLQSLRQLVFKARSQLRFAEYGFATGLTNSFEGSICIFPGGTISRFSSASYATTWRYTNTTRSLWRWAQACGSTATQS